ncbi:hypothetical protein NBO_31g0001 [Nosema bombycis CQ1]|uniref:Uncharacterized protein n=1 Tax=Nosema bombycis (strain CQ1 / CVCC 102059) TaxID=578461 RepID=R0KU00_NOSB1|nr:hypothetical protein NBO_31g0001 [Nosema bombycis CQ1]|eukprot:EOB14281.1 hypothetical protein NBO_31g0001 [Nosema bombycis CQ1]
MFQGRKKLQNLSLPQIVSVLIPATLKFHYDIDGLSGMIPQEPLNPFILNLNLKIDILENPRPVRKNCFPIDFSSVKLGFIHSYLGPISVYVVFKPICEIDLSVFFYLMWLF